MIEFGPFRYDADSRLLHRGEEEIILSPRILAVLESLLKRPGKIVPRQEVLASAWNGAFVGENSLTRAVSELRQTLGDDPQQPTYIQTVPRRGYRFIAPVSEPLRGAPDSSPREDPILQGQLPQTVLGGDGRQSEPLSPGDRLGTYELVDRIGAGAMGEVWRARDAELQRDVAIKAVPPELATDASVVERFRREARLLAAVNHPRIATIHGVEESDGRRFIIMELLEGETLQERLKRGPLSVESTLTIARQIAEALEAAHARNIIHRDLKPANVVVDSNGRAKVLDFGLAAAVSAEGPDSSDASVVTFRTARGSSRVGTAPYMSPEHAHGDPVDKRTDIWAFGCLVFELVTGRRAFERGTVAETLAAILDEEPDWELLPAGTPEGLRRLLRRCLVKGPDHRLHHIADARIEIEEALDTLASGAPGIRAKDAPPVPLGAARSRGRLLPWGVAVVALAVAAVAITGNPLGPAIEDGVRRLVIPLPAGQTLSTINAPTLALSPDASVLVFAALGPDGISRLFQRPVDGFESEEIPGSQGATIPFFSPDGHWLGFVGPGHTIYKVHLSEGRPVKVGNAPGAVWGPTWAPDDTIFFGVPQGLMRIAADGSSPPTPLTDSTGENGIQMGAWPQVLPDGRHLLFSTQVDGDWETVVFNLETGDRRTVMRNTGTSQVLHIDGHLVYPHSGQLMAVPFDLSSGEPTSAGVPLVTDVYTRRMGSGNAAYFSFSDTGALAYAAGTSDRARSRLVWVDREGVEEELPETEGRLWAPQISPDGERIVVARQLDDGTSDLWIYMDGQPASNLRTGLPANNFPIWTPDGAWITFWSASPDPTALYQQRADGVGDAQLLLHTGEVVFPGSWSPDGRTLAFYQSSLAGGFDIWTMDSEGESRLSPLIHTPFLEGASHFSPDGTLIAYIATDLDRSDVYVEPYPPTGERWPISIATDGGAEPVWSPDGETLYYRHGYQMLAVDIDTEPEFSHGVPRPLFSAPFDLNVGYLQNYDVAEGERFLMVRSWEPRTEVKVILDGFEELRESATRR